MRSLFRRFGNGRLANDIIWLYVIHFLNYLVPLLMIPYLARVLGAKDWGILAFVISFSSVIGGITEYGFYMSAQREAARKQHDLEALARLFNEVMCAKLSIACLVAVMAIVVSRFVPILKESPWLLLGGLFFGITQALSLTWYFRGIQRIKLAAGMEATAKVCSAALVFALVRSPEDAWKYFFAFGVSQLGVLIWGGWYASRDIRVEFPILRDGIKALRDGGSMFLLHATGVAFTSSSVLIIGLIAPPQMVGYFAGAERIARVLAGAMDPVRQAMFPRLSQLAQLRPYEAREQLIRVLAATGIVSAIMGIAVYIFAPQLVRLVLGREFSPAVDSLKVMAILVPVLTINGGLGYLWMLPRGFERKCVFIIFSALMVNVVLALALIPSLHQVGMAIVVTVSEVLVVLGFWMIFLKDKI